VWCASVGVSLFRPNLLKETIFTHFGLISIVYIVGNVAQDYFLGSKASKQEEQSRAERMKRRETNKNKLTVFFEWARARLATFFGWVSSLWNATQRQTEVQIIGANVALVAEVILVIDFIKKIANLQLPDGPLLLGYIAAFGVVGLMFLKLSKDALGHRG
jgi:hypothetical protein